MKECILQGFCGDYIPPVRNKALMQITLWRRARQWCNQCAYRETIPVSLLRTSKYRLNSLSLLSTLGQIFRTSAEKAAQRPHGPKS